MLITGHACDPPTGGFKGSYLKSKRKEEQLKTSENINRHITGTINGCYDIFFLESTARHIC